MMKIVLASHNVGKIRELSAGLKPFAIEIIPQADLGIADPAETGVTFVENALIKARHAALLSGLPAIADDSGLMVEALLGEPGIHSARYAGPKASSQDNIKKLLSALNAFPTEKRAACFHCTLVYLRHASDPTPLICEGTWQGVILPEPKGQEGFGYDPIFYLPTEHKTAAELPFELKNKISHRSLALQLLIDSLCKQYHLPANKHHSSLADGMDHS